MQETDFDLDVWMEISELWRILRYKSTGVGSHQAKLKAAKHLEEFIAIKLAKLLEEYK